MATSRCIMNNVYLPFPTPGWYNSSNKKLLLACHLQHLYHEIWCTCSEVKKLALSCHPCIGALSGTWLVLSWKLESISSSDPSDWIRSLPLIDKRLANSIRLSICCRMQDMPCSSKLLIKWPPVFHWLCCMKLSYLFGVSLWCRAWMGTHLLSSILLFACYLCDFFNCSRLL